ncbi:flagellar filament capping protein FliD [Paenibacillus dauci]|uniref:flagellar filament capping protein FliD n=1 Tax=Paenibacillus dauci TaxID=1567106 RepID=UPI000697AE73|nr:flagellar filament capping protein FliD [Paenibacillus dauci]
MSYMASASSALRVGGLASGMDTDSIVKKMMTAERIPLDKLNQQKQLTEWKRESYREINSKLVDFRQNKLTEFRKSDSLNANVASISGNTSAVKATALANATGAPMNVTVTQLATKDNINGAALTTASNVKATGATTLAQLNGASADSTTTYTIKINNVDLAFKGTDTITSVVNQINAKTDTKANASFDEITGKFNISAKDFGANKLNVDTSGSFAGLAGMGNEVVTQAQQAKANINGTELMFDSNTNTINGVQLSFLSTSGAAGASNITTTTDASKVVETVKSFITAYNDLLNSLKTKTEETKYKNYAPLTSDQKKEMTDDDITAWTAKSKSGSLKNDDILKSATQDMRNIITSALGNSASGTSLAAMGITTGAYNEGGKLYLDEKKLTVAIQSNPQAVISTFQDPDKGIFNQLYNKTNDSITKLADRAGTSRFSSDITAAFNIKSDMAKELTDYDKRISSLSSRLNDRETRYYNQFSAMESALSKLNSQSSSLSSYLSS